MKSEEIKIWIYSKYGGNGVSIDGRVNSMKKYVIEPEEIIAMLEKQIAEKGYTLKKANNQRYPRLTINL